MSLLQVVAALQIVHTNKRFLAQFSTPSLLVESMNASLD
jgi:hypothetical protein